MEPQELQPLEHGDILTDKVQVNSLTTAQVVSILRFGLFTPSTRNAGEVNEKHRKLDVSEDFRSLTFSKKEGFTDINIIGLKLNIETDFKVWCGIVRVFNSYGFKESGITIKFTEFAKLCGFKSKQLDLKLRQRIDNALVKLRSQTIRFTTKESKKAYVGGLISSAAFDVDEDKIHIIPDASLWELYQIDRIIIFKLEAMNKLPRMEAAQCLYMFIAALPQHPHPISFKRIRERMLLSSPLIKEQNRTITNAIKKLIEIGYLQGQIVTTKNAIGDKEKYLLIEERSPKLLLRSVPV